MAHLDQSGTLLKIAEIHTRICGRGLLLSGSNAQLKGYFGLGGRQSERLRTPGGKQWLAWRPAASPQSLRGQSQGGVVFYCRCSGPQSRPSAGCPLFFLFLLLLAYAFGFRYHACSVCFCCNLKATARGECSGRALLHFKAEP